MRGKSEANLFANRAHWISPEGKLIVSRVQGRAHVRRKSEEKEQKKEDDKDRGLLLDTDMEF